jgi:hypothetical protein
MPLAGNIPGLPKSLPGDASEKLTDRAVTADLLIKDGVLSSVTVDMAQLNPKASWSDHLPIRLTLSRQAAAIEAPSGVTVITEKDLDAMAQMMTDGMGQDYGMGDDYGMGGDDGTDPDSFTSDDDGAPDEV